MFYWKKHENSVKYWFFFFFWKISSKAVKQHKLKVTLFLQILNPLILLSGNWKFSGKFKSKGIYYPVLGGYKIIGSILKQMFWPHFQEWFHLPNKTACTMIIGSIVEKTVKKLRLRKQRWPNCIVSFLIWISTRDTSAPTSLFLSFKSEFMSWE